MTTASVAGTAPRAKGRSQSSWLIRWSPLGGLLFVLGFIVVMTSPLGNARVDSGAEYVDYALSNSGWLNAGMIFVLAALLLVPWFVVGLYARLRSIGAETESILALIGGVTFSVLFFVGMTIWIAPALYLPDRDDPALRLRDAETFLGIAELNWFMLGGAGVGLGLMIFAASIAMLRTRATPAWAAWLSIVFGLAALTSVVVVGLFAWTWIAIASLVLLVKEHQSSDEGQ